MRAEQLNREFDSVDAERLQIERLGEVARIQRLARNGGNTEHGSIRPFDTGDTGTSSLRSKAMRVLDGAVRDERMSGRGAEIVERLMQTGSPISQTWTQRWAVATGAEAYTRAFAKKLADADNGHLTWTSEEADAWRAVIAVQSEQRAMSLTDTAGGFLVPAHLDPAILLTSAGSNNPLRSLARVEQITGDVWNGVSSGGVTAEWLGEGSEAADASPTLAQPSVPVYKASVFVPFSVEIQGDGLGFMTELGRLLRDGADQLLATAFTVGSGSGQPTGIITALAGGSSVVSGTGTEALLAGDPYLVQNSLPPRFQPRASWAANLSIVNTLRQFETAGGALKFPGLQNSPPVLLGRTMNEVSNMDGTINAAATEANYLLLYGDFKEFLIADRLGSQLEIVSHLVGSNRRPTGQRGAWLWLWTGSDVLVDNAFRVLNVATTA